jgi:aspartate carbamoyltransferase catalytic subunit
MGVSLKDTALTLEAMGADAVVIRHEASGAARRLTNWISGRVVNAGDGTHEHPTQALLDAFTMRQFFPGGATPRTPRCPPGAGLIAKTAIVSGPPQADEELLGASHTPRADEKPRMSPRTPRGPAGAVPDNRDDRRGKGLDGVRVTIVGDVLHSRVARSNVLLLSTLGAQVTMVAPPTLMPHAIETWPCRASYDLDAELRKSDVVMMLRVQQERMSAAYFPTVREYRRRYGLDAGRMALLPEHAIVMHPGPMNRGVEIAAEVADSDRSTIVAQVANGVTVRMAVLYLMLGGAGEETS